MINWQNPDDDEDYGYDVPFETEESKIKIEMKHIYQMLNKYQMVIDLNWVWYSII